METGQLWLETGPALGLGWGPRGYRRPELGLGLGPPAGVWAWLWVGAGSVALAGAAAWNSGAQEGWVSQVVWVWGAALSVCLELGMGRPEAGAWAALW